MGTVGSYEAKTHLSELLKRVSKGERITVTKHGVPIAELVPVVGGERRLSRRRSPRSDPSARGVGWTGSRYAI